MSPPLLAEGLLNMRQAVEFTGLSRSTLWRMMSAGDIAFLHDPKLRVRLIPKRALMDWAQARLHGP